MLARMARRASLTLRKRRSSRMDSLGNHYRESMSSVFVEDKLGIYIAVLIPLPFPTFNQQNPCEPIGPREHKL